MSGSETRQRSKVKVVRQVAEMHGGSAWVAPRGGRGAEIHLRIPALRRTGLPV
jgi:signal transduction histidine kinase